MEEVKNLKNVMIANSKSLKNKEKYIYVGTEKITFQERHPVFQMVLREEFRDAVRLYK